MRGVFGETVRVFSPGLDTATDPFSGESVPSWTWPDTVEYTGVPVEPDVPLAIQARAAGYLTACGLGPVRRWPH